MKISDVKTFVLGTTWRNLTFVQEHFNDFAEEFVKAAPGNPEVVDGHFALPGGPGLEVSLDPGVIEAHPRRSIFFNLFADDWHRRQAERQGLPA